MSEKQTSADDNLQDIPPEQTASQSADTNEGEPNSTDDLHAALADADASRENDQLSFELAEAKAHTLRAQAELENFRKRMRREMELEQRYAALPIVSDLLPVVDNLQRALAAAGDNEASASLVAGVKMVADHMSNVLEKHGCVKLQPLGEDFDPNFHEAIAQQPSDTQAPGTVLHVTQTGYKIHDRVVRPAQVVVVAGQSEEKPADSPSEE